MLAQILRRITKGQPQSFAVGSDVFIKQLGMRRPLKCKPTSWLQSYSIASASSTGFINTNLTDDVLSNRLPFLVPLLYSAASITGAGFGDFDPQNPGEFVFAVFLAFCGVFLAGYYTAKLTSAIAASNLLR